MNNTIWFAFWLTLLIAHSLLLGARVAIQAFDVWLIITIVGLIISICGACAFNIEPNPTGRQRGRG